MIQLSSWQKNFWWWWFSEYIYKSTLDTLELRKDKGIGYVLSWKSKGVCNSKLKQLYNAFLHNIKLSRYKVRIKFYKDPLAVKQNNHTTKIVNAFIVYDLNNWPNNPLRNVTLKISCLLQLVQ